MKILHYLQNNPLPPTISLSQTDTTLPTFGNVFGKKATTAFLLDVKNMNIVLHLLLLPLVARITETVIQKQNTLRQNMCRQKIVVTTRTIKLKAHDVAMLYYYLRTDLCANSFLLQKEFRDKLLEKYNTMGIMVIG